MIVETLTLSVSLNSGKIILEDHFNLYSLFSFISFAVLSNSIIPAEVDKLSLYAILYTPFSLATSEISTFIS